MTLYRLGYSFTNIDMKGTIMKFEKFDFCVITGVQFLKQIDVFSIDADSV